MPAPAGQAIASGGRGMRGQYMIGAFDKGRLYELLKDFYTVVGIRISIFDDEFHPVTEYPEEPPELCRMIRSTEDGAKACAGCDRDACLRARKLGAAHTYICHAGLTEAITPLNPGGGVIGYAIFAHMMPEEDRSAAIDEVVRRCVPHYGTEEKIRRAAENIKAQSTERILSAAKLLNAIAAYLIISGLAVWRNEDFSRQIDRYIDENMAGDLDTDTLCGRFYVSRTKLHTVSVRAFGMSIAQYIAHKRIEKACKMLRESDSTITDIAAAVGVPDYNYFCKFFRKHVGISPGAYRAKK